MYNIAISYDNGKNITINQFETEEEYNEWSIEMHIADEDWVELLYRGRDLKICIQEAKTKFVSKQISIQAKGLV